VLASDPADIKAKTEHDAFFAQGFVTAQDVRVNGQLWAAADSLGSFRLLFALRLRSAVQNSLRLNA
jgi:hypothetical protein